MIFFLFISSVYSLQILVDVKGNIKGKVGFFNYTKETKNLAWFFLNWENAGSIGCKVRMRVDIFNSTNLIYTSWSKSEAIEPGGNADFYAFWYPTNNGSFVALIRIYQCNEIFNVKQVNLSAIITGKKEIKGNITISNDKRAVYLEILPQENLTDLVAFVSDYPKGWIFTYDKVDSVEAGKKVKLRIDYEAEIWKEKPIKIELIANGGKFHKTVSLILKKPSVWVEFFKDPWKIATILLFLLNIYLIRKKIILVSRKLRVGGRFEKNYRHSKWKGRSR